MAAQPQRAQSNERPPIAGEAFLRALADHGIDYFFANPGTDFPPIVEAFSRAKQSNAKVPTPLVIPHENLAVAMAHGAYAMSGRPQAVMLHVNVGTANAINNIINLNRDNIPLILAAGRTPITEKGKFGGRNRYIHWGQEMFDQGGMLREAVKWDYELRVPEQITDVVSRAYEITMSSPRGPVYLSLPREPLAAPMPEPLGPVKPRHVPAPPHADPAMIATLAEWIAAAEKPLIITTASGAEAMAPLGRIAEKYALPGRHAAPARGLPAVEPSDAHGLRPAGAAAGGRSRHRARRRRAVDPERAAPARGRPLRHARRGPGVPPLSDAELPERSRHHLEDLERAGNAGAGAGQALVSRGAHPGAPHPRRRVQQEAQGCARQGLRDAHRRQDHLRLSRAAWSARRSATTPSSSTNTR